MLRADILLGGLLIGKWLALTCGLLLIGMRSSHCIDPSGRLSRLFRWDALDGSPSIDPIGPEQSRCR
ncbi:MAG: hypothetical protein RMM98_14025 [Acidobacteriota bacterium]|nr:hypothetical protein [Blastocatellia bacterium]MDW8240723.1 hypothetical protein [Acidobacteriota bacterium]